MYAYCNNNPVMNVDPNGEKTYSFGWGFSLYFIGGLAYSIDVVVDDEYNVGIQVSEANVFKKQSGAVIGLIGAYLGPTRKMTLSDTIYDLEGEGFSTNILNFGSQSISLNSNLSSEPNVELEISQSASNGGFTKGPSMTISRTTTLCSFNFIEFTEAVERKIDSWTEKIKSWFN